MPTPTTTAGLATEYNESTPELEQLVATLRIGADDDRHCAEQLATAIARWRRPPRIQVTGRARSGKSTLLQALALMSAEETGPVDEPGVPEPVLDADLVVYVLATVPQPADRRILAELSPERTVVVLNKADAVGACWTDAVEAADRCTRELDMLTLPVVAVLAARTRAGTVTDDDLRTLRRHVGRQDPSFTLSPDLFTAPSAGTDIGDRRTLLERWDLYGVACALTALRYETDLCPQTLLQLLHTVSGIDPVHDLLRRRYAQLSSLRGGEFLDELSRSAARAVPRGDGGARTHTAGNCPAGSVEPDAAGGRARDLIEDYLCGNEALWLGVRAGLACPDVTHLAAGYPTPQPTDADDALARAARWRAVVSSDMPAAAQRAAIRVHNGYMRIRERLSSAGL